ncbi:MAG: YebC/PmpR family DNA-binding transcriptional regulator [bacterium]
MSGHSKWSTIKRKKGAKDAARSKVWSKIIREITVAARGGSDPDSNARLRAALTMAKSSNMPNDTVDKAIKRGTGELAGAIYEEMSYEGYGPGGVAILVETQTDNKNRTAAEVRHVFTKYNGKLGSAGCVSYLFDRQGVVVLDAGRCDLDTAMDAAIDAGAEDVATEEGSIVITTGMEDLHRVTQALETAGLPVVSSELTLNPQTTVKVEGGDARAVLDLIEALDDLDDVSAVSANFDLDDDELAALSE